MYACIQHTAKYPLNSVVIVLQCAQQLAVPTGAITTDKKLGSDAESEVELNGAAADADMAADDAMADLLMCLGLEEQKTQMWVVI